MRARMRFSKLISLVEGVRKQLGVASGIPVEEYSMAVGVREISPSEIRAVEVNYFRRAFIELVKFQGKIIFFPTRVSFSKSVGGVGITAEPLIKYLKGRWVPFKNFRKFSGTSLEDQKEEFLRDFLKTIIERSKFNPVEVIVTPYSEDFGFLVDDYPITKGKTDKPFFFRGVAYSLNKLSFESATPEKILLFRRISGESITQFSRDIPWKEFWNRVEKGEISVKGGKNFLKVIEKWIRDELESRAYELEDFGRFSSIIREFI